MDELFVTMQGRRQYLWRAVDEDGDVLDILVQARLPLRAPADCARDCDDSGDTRVADNKLTVPRTLIRELSIANPLWGAPRIHGELLKLGISVSQSTVAKYMRRHARPPSQTWRTFLANHATPIMAADFVVVPTVTFRLLFVLVILAHDRRRIVHVAVTDHPTAAWTAQQRRNAFPDDEAPR